MSTTDKRPTILVVDDDPDELATTCEALSSSYRVLAESSGDAALSVARSAQPSVIVLDVMMPGGRDGFAVFHELRRDPATREIPIVFLTSVNRFSGLPFGSAEFEKYLGGAPAAFLEKPLPAADLLRGVATAMEQKTRKSIAASSPPDGG